MSQAQQRLPARDDARQNPPYHDAPLHLEAISTHALANTFPSTKKLANEEGPKNGTAKRPRDIDSEVDKLDRDGYQQHLGSPCRSDMGPSSQFLIFSSQENVENENSLENNDCSSGNKLLRAFDTTKGAVAETPNETGICVEPLARIADDETIRKNHTPACRYNVVRTALLRFKELYGSQCVKRGFSVPVGSSEWPEETWGIRLDLAVRKIREGTTYADHMEDLKSLGFTFCSRKAGYGFDTLRDGVVKYRELYGDMNISRAFIVPSNDPNWPPNMWGVHLGSCLRDIKRGKCYADRKEELNAIGYNSIENGPGGARNCNKKCNFSLVRTAFQTYKRVHGDLQVQAKYVVPSDDENWPRETWGIKLGTYTQLIRMGKYGEDKKDELNALGFLFENQRAKYGFELIKSALIRHRELYGNFLVKQKFRIPSGESIGANQWPEEMWGINLGNVLHDIRQGDSYRSKKEELEEMGITFYSHKQPRGRQGNCDKKQEREEETEREGVKELDNVFCTAYSSTSVPHERDASYPDNTQGEHFTFHHTDSTSDPYSNIVSLSLGRRP